MSAYVLVSSTITATINAAPLTSTSSTTDPAATTTPASSSSVPQPTGNSTNNRTSANPNAPKREPLCAAVAVTCSGKVPMRISLDGEEEKIDSTQQCTLAQTAQSMSLCASPGSDLKSLDVTVEY